MLSIFKLKFLFLFAPVLVSGVPDIGSDHTLNSLAPIPPTPAIPHIQRPVRPHTAGVIRGLLAVRQSCPVGDTDCGDGGCCPAGEKCYAGGCCLNSEKGCRNEFCCDPSETCCSDGCCPVSGGVCCVDSHCCPSGSYCVAGGCCLDGKVCIGVSGGGGSSNPTTKAPIPITTVFTQKIATTTEDHSVPSPTKTSTGSAVATIPAAPAGSQNIVVDVVTNVDISWTGEWVTVQSSCSSGKNAKTVGGHVGAGNYSNGIMSYSFFGSSVYVSVASTNAEYSIFIDEDITYYSSGGPSGSDLIAPGNCTIGWSRTDLSAEIHTFIISSFGPPVSSGTNRRDFEASWSLELQNFVITQSDSQVSSSGEARKSPPSATAAGIGGSNGGGALSPASQISVPWSSFCIALVSTWIRM